jgi:hypothetical protein
VTFIEGQLLQSKEFQIGFFFLFHHPNFDLI